MGLTVLFDTIHESHYTISTNFYLYLQYFQQKVPKILQGSMVLLSLAPSFKAQELLPLQHIYGTYSI